MRAGWMLTTALLAAPAAATGLQPFQAEDGRYGYRDASGTERVAPRYDFAFPFMDGYAKVHLYDDRRRRLTGLLDATGREVIAPGVSDVHQARTRTGSRPAGVYTVDGGILQVDEQRWLMPPASVRGDAYCRNADADDRLCLPDRRELLLQHMRRFCQVIDLHHVSCDEGEVLYVDGREQRPPEGGRFKEVVAEHDYAIVETGDYETLVYALDGRRLTPDAPHPAFYFHHHYSPAAERFVSVHLGRPASFGRHAEIFDRDGRTIARIALPMGPFHAWGFEPDGYLKHRDRDYVWHYIRLRDGVETDPPGAERTD